MLSQPSSLSPRGAALWSPHDLNTLADPLFQVQDHFSTVYPNLDPLRLDLEVKIDRNGEVVVKQARPYVSVDP